MYPEERDFPPGQCLFRQLPAETKCCLPASIAVVIPRRLSGVFLKPLFDWKYPNSLPLSLKGDACWYIIIKTLNSPAVSKHLTLLALQKLK